MCSIRKHLGSQFFFIVVISSFFCFVLFFSLLLSFFFSLSLLSFVQLLFHFREIYSGMKDPV